uniref:Uncharacterized protein n=1 Tax=Angiostrongylus cantonensis TaxID=6313 RepID=A0A0K0DD74_ANGCA
MEGREERERDVESGKRGREQIARLIWDENIAETIVVVIECGRVAAGGETSYLKAFTIFGDDDRHCCLGPVADGLPADCAIAAASDGSGGNERKIPGDKERKEKVSEKWHCHHRKRDIERESVRLMVARNCYRTGPRYVTTTTTTATANDDEDDDDDDDYDYDYGERITVAGIDE